MEKNKRKVSSRDSASRATASDTPYELGLEQNRFKLTKLDYILAPLVALLTAVWTFRYFGTAINWDDLLYMDLALRTVPDAHVMNRYGHIYFLKFFLFLTGDSIISGKLWWCFVYLGTGVLVYWCGKLLAPKRGWFVGIVAAAFFYIQSLFAKEFGSPLADFTIMFMVMLGVFVYLAFPVHNQKHRFWILMVLGFIFFWAMKSKETAVCMAVLFLGLGEDAPGVRSFKRFAKDIGWVFVGGLSGCLILMVLDLVFMGDILFSVQWTDIKEVVRSNAFNPPPDELRPLTRNREVMSWYAGIAKKPLLVTLFVPFILYLLVGFKSIVREYNFKEKMVWLIPLGLLLFLTYARGRFWVLDRYYAPAIPLVCVWAAQFFWFDVSESLWPKKDGQAIPGWLVAAGLFFLAFLLVCLFMSFVPRLADYYNFMRYDALRIYFRTNENVFYAVGIVPSVVSVILAMGTLFKRRGLGVMFVSFLCLFLVIYQPIIGNYDRMKASAQKSIGRFEPYKVFGDEIKFNDKMKILVSETVHRSSWMLGNNLSRQRWIFNIFFNQKLSDNNFIYATLAEGEKKDIFKDIRQTVLNGGYDYGFVTEWDINGMTAEQLKQLRSDYVIRKKVFERYNRPIQIIFLKKK
ncbi:MAG TPA: hypothetical protein ENH34_01185 [Phycisphaerales bacterium]|nr:hypothetical protein [Phycisphaerales bacterium]